MSAQIIRTNGDAGESALKQQAEDLTLSGALHEQNLKHQPRRGRREMQRELNRLHANAIKKQVLPSIAGKLSPDPARHDFAQTQHKAQTPDKQVSGPGQTGWHRRSPPTLGKQAMRRWHAETTADQPWVPFHDMDDATRGSFKMC
jgi:hypothetical protein